MGFSFRKLTYVKKRILAACTGRTNVHFLHIRKTGGTALKSVLCAHQITPVAVLHLHPHRIGLADLPKGHRIMFVTRDPISRYISGFGSRLRQGAPAHNVPWSKDEALAFSRFPDANSLALALDPAHEKHSEALHAMKSITHIDCSYWDWFGSEQELMSRRDSILFAGQIESFESDFEELKTILELPASAALPLDPKTANAVSSQCRSAVRLEARAVALLRSWYRRDYDFLDFCNQWRAEQGGAVARLTRDPLPKDPRVQEHLQGALILMATLAAQFSDADILG